MSSDENQIIPKKKRGPKKGNPYKKIDWEQVKIWLRFGGTATSIAGKIGLDRDTLYRRCLEENKVNFSAYSQEFREHGNLDLHIMQYKIAMTGNTKMLLHLGEFRLGQIRKSTKETQDIIEGLSEIVEDFRDSKAEREKAS